MRQTRRTYLKGTAVSALIGTGALSGLSGSAMAQLASASQFGIDDGFADTSWLDDGVDVYRITEPTRAAVEEGSSPPDGGNGDDGDTGGLISTGTYEITNVNSGQLLEVANAETTDGANVQQHSDTGHATQQWYIEETEDGEYLLENENSGLLLEVANDVDYDLSASIVT